MSISSVASSTGRGPGIYGPISPAGITPKEKSVDTVQVEALRAALRPEPVVNLIVAQAAKAPTTKVDGYI